MQALKPGLATPNTQPNLVAMTDPDASDSNTESAGVAAFRVLPEEFTTRLEEIYGNRTALDILDTMVGEKRFAFWANTLRDVDVPADAQPVSGLDDCFELPATQRDAFMRLDATVAGDFYPINPASVAAARCLDVAPDQEVLDLAAAPGGTLTCLLWISSRDGGLTTLAASKLLAD